MPAPPVDTITPASIYKAIFSGKTVAVACPSDKFNSLRVAIAKQHQTPKALELTDDSLLSTWAAGIATFRLGTARKATGFSIIAISESEE